MSEPEVFDYIVVGAGTAGCVVASRLADTGQSVLLVEQGSDGTDKNIETADLEHLFQLWEDQNHIANYPMDPRSTSVTRWPELMRGRTVGGSGAVNVMIHTRANRADLDGWAAMGNPGWGFDDLLPYYRMSETDPAGESYWHGGAGPIQLSLPERSVYSDAMEAAAVEVGFHGPDWDFNDGKQAGGAGRYRFAADAKGRRSSSASAYLRPAEIRHPGTLEVRTNDPVLRLLLSEGDGPLRATGIVCRNPGSWFEHEVHASKRVIVCAGAIESPKLLMLSGIGPAAHLDEIGIAPVVELPGVGQNLQDHVITGVQFAGTAANPKLQFLTESGLFACVQPAHSGDYYWPDGHPTVQFFMNAGVPGRGFPWAPKNFFGIFPSLTRPETTGEVVLTAKDPRRPPTIRMDYLSSGNDLDVLINAVRLALELGQTKALSGLNAGVLPIPTYSELQPLDQSTPRDTIAEYLLLTARGLWHPACTCAMGPDAASGSVVNAALNVHGVEHLSVCDASVFPTMTCGNPNATVIAVAEKFAADLIRSEG